MEQFQTTATVIPDEVPVAELEAACTIINEAIRFLLSRPDTAAEFQRWKQERTNTKNENSK